MIRMPKTFSLIYAILWAYYPITDAQTFALYPYQATPENPILEGSQFQAYDAGLNVIDEQIQSHLDVNLYFHPQRAFIDNTKYVYSYPDPEDYVIQIAVDPCRFLNYSCCMNVFGSPEYPALIKDGLEQERVVRYTVLGNDTEVQGNYQAVYDDGSLIPTSALRQADDEKIIYPNCTARNVPYSFCAGYQFAYRRSPQRPACMDNNVTLDALAGCLNPDGTSGGAYCVQVGYSQNAFIPMCNNTLFPNCGTFLEVHMVKGTMLPTVETDVISMVRLETRNVSGMYTTVLPLTWMNDPTKVLCSYVETEMRVGSTVYILPTAPVCCCMYTFVEKTKQGSFVCPIGAKGRGPYATYFKDLAEIITVDTAMLQYPFCHTNLDGPDKIMCSVYDVHNRRNYTRECKPLEQGFQQQQILKWSSADLQGAYDAQCPYTPGCGYTMSQVCQFRDSKMSFIGRVGRITQVNNELSIPTVRVTFNDGRTDYEFMQRDVQLEYRKKSMYEIWWVVRTRSNRVVQKRKGFNITHPQCTFDSINDRYLPYAKLQLSRDDNTTWEAIKASNTP